MVFHDDEEKENSDLLESAVDEVLDKEEEDEDLDIPIADPLLDDEKGWE